MRKARGRGSDGVLISMVLFARGGRVHISGLPWGKDEKGRDEGAERQGRISLKSLTTFFELQHDEGNL